MKIKNYDYLNQEMDVSEQFYTLGNVHFCAQKLDDFSPESGIGTLNYTRYERKGRIGFNLYSTPFEPTNSWSFPPRYSDTPTYPLSVDLISDNVVRIRTTCVLGQDALPDHDDASLILNGRPGKLSLTPTVHDDNRTLYKTDKMEVEVRYNPFHIIVRDSNGRELVRTLNLDDSKCLGTFYPMPFSYVRSATDLHKYPAVSLSLHPNEHFYGCGESFTPVDKRGQKVTLWAKDANGVETDSMYKPVPFYISSRGYGVLYHTTHPVSVDFGKEYAEAQTAFMADENIDFFIFVGEPKEVLGAYTGLTGRSPVPPLWSYGLWMSRITYKTEEEVREVSKKLRENKVPCDVIHLDTGWFQNDWLCDYKFSDRFDDPKKMIGDLKEAGHRISLWQIPYFTPGNPLYDELIEKGLAVAGNDSPIPTDDAILDFSNPDAVNWYQERLKELFDMGVAAIKADFGEAAPITGRYHSGRSGLAEHNLYPLRYNKAVFEITEKTHGEGQGVIWGRSAWAGSQRYPLHWGGDCENTNMGMLSSLRGGLSFGASGFGFWSHDVGGFVYPSEEELYIRWTFFGIFTSHMRCHGQPPKEPWAFSDSFLNEFRRLLELRYRLMPYIYAQSIDCSNRGLPLLRGMYIEHPKDPSCAGLDDQYYFGNDMIIAPLFEEERRRMVYLPAGAWVELGTNKVLEGEKWYDMEATVFPGLAFVKGNAVIPVVDVALTTDDIDWSTLRCVQFAGGNAPQTGLMIDYANKSIHAIDGHMPVIQSAEESF